MRKLLLIALLSAVVTTVQAKKDIRDSLVTAIADGVREVQFCLRGQQRYQLCPTENIYTFLRLDTSTGLVTIVQWSQQEGKEFLYPLNEEQLSPETEFCGTYMLVPTDNLYTFLLLNRFDGRVWHVQWDFDKEKRWIRQIR